jgi:hypothetical protein
MASRSFTLIDTAAAVVRAEVARDRVRLSPDAIKAALGWELKPQGLCRDAACIPVPSGSAGSDGIDLAELAKLLDRPLAVDLTEGVAYLGASARERSHALAALEAPDFALPDLGGRLHRLSEHRGKKVLLVAYASW